MSKKCVLIIIPIVSTGCFFIFNDILNNIYFVVFFSFTNSLIIFYLIPKLTSILYTRPIYYENIELVQRRTKRYTLQNYFRTFIALSYSTFFTLLLWYFFNIFNYTPNYLRNKYTFIEFVGIFGGFCSLYFKIQTYIGKGLLFCLLKYKDAFELDTDSLEMFPGYYEDVGMEPTPYNLDHETMVKIQQLIAKSNSSPSRFNSPRRINSPIFHTNPIVNNSKFTFNTNIVIPKNNSENSLNNISTK